ncbi:MAG: 16S rRNA (guanine(966)-N(2))-methyltransferase RsmD [Geminicoccaceae bacterium]
MGVMRIVGGQFRGKLLHSPHDRGVRPTSDRTREALFNILEHDTGIRERRFLDLFCGTGAVGLEAYSRAAAEVWLMDRDLTVAARNVEAFGNPPTVFLRRRNLPTMARPPARFDIVFLDPPYQSDLVEPALGQLRQGWLAEDCRLVIELSSKTPFAPPTGFVLEQERRYGAAKLVFLSCRC